MRRTVTGLTVLALLAVLGCANAPAGPGGTAGPGGADDGPRPATAEDLLGRWYPADGAHRGAAFAEFDADGGWTGSDGCNGQGGTWALDPDGTFAGSAGPSTLIACDNVPVARWVGEAGRAEADGGDLLLVPATGDVPARLVRELP
ncbi:hypothetical protein WIS52_27640 [Pseudonocardia nematodicida]|uniref:META domain-containing protein n=1 Tax=Pseudonocardia nematodicida TaxID=1206997 RepID=A0ABV1KJ94_9PSEU